MVEVSDDCGSSLRDVIYEQATRLVRRHQFAAAGHGNMSDVVLILYPGFRLYLMSLIVQSVQSQTCNAKVVFCHPDTARPVYIEVGEVRIAYFVLSYARQFTRRFVVEVESAAIGGDGFRPFVHVSHMEMLVPGIFYNGFVYQLPRPVAAVFPLSGHATFTFTPPFGIACGQLLLPVWSHDLVSSEQHHLIAVVTAHTATSLKPHIARLVLPYPADDVGRQSVSCR